MKNKLSMRGRQYSTIAMMGLGLRDGNREGNFDYRCVRLVCITASQKAAMIVHLQLQPSRLGRSRFVMILALWERCGK